MSGPGRRGTPGSLLHIGAADADPQAVRTAALATLFYTGARVSELPAGQDLYLLIAHGSRRNLAC
jgi:hypothetical protein